MFSLVESNRKPVIAAGESVSFNLFEVMICFEEVELMSYNWMIPLEVAHASVWLLLLEIDKTKKPF